MFLRPRNKVFGEMLRKEARLETASAGFSPGSINTETSAFLLSKVLAEW